MQKRLVAAAAVVAALAIAATQLGRGSAQPAPVPPPATRTQGISVVSEGIVTAQPNVARITLGVDVFNQSLAAAQSDAASRMDAVMQKLKADGVADSDIRTTSFSVSPQYDFREKQQGVLRGYQVSNIVEVKTGNVSGVGALVDDVVGAGATRVLGIRFESDDPSHLKELARDQAMKNARAKADQLARDAGVSVGQPLSIDESDLGGVTPVRAERMAVPAAAAPAPTTPIEPGELQVRAVVRVVWAIQ